MERDGDILICTACDDMIAVRREREEPEDRLNECPACGVYGGDGHECGPANERQQSGPEQAVPGEGSPSTEGTTSMSDITYDGVIKGAAQAVTAAEERAAEVERTIAMAEAQAAEAAIAQRWADVAADQMQALKVDSGTLGAMADHQDALAAAEKAHQAVLEALGEAKKAQAQVTETAQNVSATLQRGHAGLAEAHQNAPVEAADRGFYQD